MGNLDENKVFITSDEAAANEMAGRFEAGYTCVIKNHDDTEFMVQIRPLERHKLTQAERDSMVEMPSDFLIPE